MEGYEKPKDENQPITGFSIKVKKENNAFTAVAYDFGLEYRNYFSPGQRVELHNVS